MKVKIGDKVYDAEDQPIMIILSDGDKKNIYNMGHGCYKYCAYPDEGYTEDDIDKWMNDALEG